MLNKIIAFLTNLILIPSQILPNSPVEGTIVRVIDGDTCKAYINNHMMTIRLSYIDAPELKQECGQDSRNRLSYLLLNRQAAITLNGKDKYGRSIATINTVNDGNVNDWMLKHGWAWHYKKYDHTKQKEYHSIIESNAKEKKIGLWSYSNPIPPWDYRE